MLNASQTVLLVAPFGQAESYPMKKLLLLAALLMVTASWPVVNAQQQEPALKPTVSPKKIETPIGLMLEVTYNPTIPPAFIPVRSSEEKPAWTWVTRFIRIPGAQTPPPIRAVKIEPKFNGETADVRITLLRGVNGFDQEDLVGLYHVGLGEQKTIDDLKAVGVEPFNVTLLNAAPSLPPPPGLENLTKSIEIVSIQPENSQRPAYRITLRNLAGKMVRAIRLDVRNNGRPGQTSLLQGEEGRPLIEPNGTLERAISVLRAERTPAGYVPGTASENTIFIRTVVFADLSFEGELEAACTYESFEMGNRLWLKRVLPLLDEAVAAPLDDHIEAARQFKEKFSALKYELDENEGQQPSTVSSGCQKPAVLAHISPDNLRLQMLRDLDEIITTRPAPPVNFKTWLETRRTTYKAWLSRL